MKVRNLLLGDCIRVGSTRTGLTTVQVDSGYSCPPARVDAMLAPCPFQMLVREEGKQSSSTRNNAQQRLHTNAGEAGLTMIIVFCSTLTSHKHASIARQKRRKTREAKTKRKATHDVLLPSAPTSCLTSSGAYLLQFPVVTPCFSLHVTLTCTLES